MLEIKLKKKYYKIYYLVMVTNYLGRYSYIAIVDRYNCTLEPRHLTGYYKVPISNAIFIILLYNFDYVPNK